MDKNIIDFLPPNQQECLKHVAAICKSHQASLYLVGGTVRDLLLKKTPSDLDISIEGLEISLVNKIVRCLNGVIIAISKFNTAKILIGNISMDLAMSRSEVYKDPGALPTVKPGLIVDDLGRRDFSVNALCVSLNEKDWGSLIDPHGGYSDLQSGIIRVLDSKSFIEDATRIIRAIRYSVRLDFCIEPETETLMKQHLRYIDTIHGDRLNSELMKVFREIRVSSILMLAHNTGILHAIFPTLKVYPQLIRKLEQDIDSRDENTDMIFLSVLSFTLSFNERRGFIRRLNMTKRHARVVIDTGVIKCILDQLSSIDMKNSVLFRLLKDVDIAAIRGSKLAVQSELIAKRLHLFEGELRHYKPKLDGNDLLQLGVPQGEIVGQILWKLTEGGLDGTIKTIQDEMNFVRCRLQL